MIHQFRMGGKIGVVIAKKRAKINFDVRTLRLTPDLADGVFIFPFMAAGVDLPLRPDAGCPQRAAA